MAALNSFQKISRVLPGQPFGDGVDGVATISSDPNTRATITGTATQYTGTAGSSAFANGDVVILHQTQGTGVGQWEINKIVSGGGSTSLTFQSAHNYTYGTGAQIIKVPRYTTATVNAHNLTAWDGTTGGIEVICASLSATTGGVVNGNTKGFRGGTTNSTDGAMGHQGEGTAGAGDTHNYTANGNGGGGGDDCTGTARYGGGGGGGGHAAAGSTGEPALSDGTPQQPAAGGTAVDAADGTTFNLGGGGGGGSSQGAASGAGGAGGGSIMIITKSFTCSSNAVNMDGGNGTNGDAQAGAGGGGAGGACLVVCGDAVLGTNKITVAAGTKGTVEKDGGDGSVGRIAVQHSGTVTGTTTPSFTDSSDPSLVDDVGSYIFMTT